MRIKTIFIQFTNLMTPYIVLNDKKSFLLDLISPHHLDDIKELN